MRNKLTIAVVLLLSAFAVPADAKSWVASWAASPAAPLTQPSATRRISPSFDNQTIVQVVRLSAGGSAVRVRFTNEFGLKPLVIGKATVTALGADGREVGETMGLTFGGSPTASVPAGAPIISDAVPLTTKALGKLRIAIYLPEPTPLCTCHSTGGEPVHVSPQGDYTRKAFETAAGVNPGFRAFLSEVLVEQARPTPVVVAFGDSITDGFRSTLGADKRWPDRLSERLIDRLGGRAPAVVNAGIGGNRILADGSIPVLGQSALTRFDRDVLSMPGATHLIILEGINDIGGGGETPPTATALIAGLQQMIARARMHGIKVIGGTILPYEGAAYYRPQGEIVRQSVNAWIRTSGAFDGLIDFDAVMRDPAIPTRMKEALQSGDWLHPNDAGYSAMGDAIDLALFR